MKHYALSLIVLITMPYQPSSAAELGRLFFTPTQRAAMDKASGKTPQANSRLEQALRLDGIVHRPHAEPIVWLNGQRQKLPLASQKVGADSLQFVDAQGRHQDLKVGESLLVAISPAMHEQSP